MNHEVILTCAVTGGGDTVGKHPAIPVTPRQIADAAIEAAKAGASVVHCHVRDPKTGKGGRDLACYREMVGHIRASRVDIVINLTCGMGGDMTVDDANPMVPGQGTDLIDWRGRIAHVEELLPEICTLDCGSMNFGDTNTIAVQTPNMLRAMAKRVKELGVKPELEVFDAGQLAFGKRMHEEGLLSDPPLFQLCLGIPWGAPADGPTMSYMASQLPPGAVWAGFGISRMQMPMVAQAVILGGNCRVGLEDNLYLERGVFASNGQLVEKASRIIRDLGGRVLTPAETRKKLGLKKQR